ncbi:hypothetical protein AYO44_05780 [Planctomycetaceae bacterium SCGC AG-212-F19]|nr:hypothetical protein AYO44_05780 [Planctomycetaceae bacterium SCGC AG-212-F19]
MVHDSPAGVLQYIRALVAPARADTADDAALLHRFAAQRDEAAFVALLQRHGPLVLGVCRQVLADPHAAEDAFQATFLVLARKASSLTCRDSLGPWLHRVALRAATKVERAAGRRHAREQEAGAMQSHSDDPPPAADWQPILHEEIDRLPTKYRTPVVLCYLNGQTHEAAAQELRWPVGTVKGRLSEARAILSRRLARRGVTLSVGAWTVAASTGEAVPPALLASTARAALQFTAGGGTVPPSLLALAGGLLHDMLWSRLQSAAVVIVTVGLLGAGAALVAFQAAGPPPTAPAGAARAADSAGLPAVPPIRKDADGIPLPEGAIARLGAVRWRHGGLVNSVAFAPRGNLLASAGGDRLIRLWDFQTGRELRACAGHTDAVQFVAFAPDGRTLASISPDQTIRIWDAATGKELAQLPGGMRVTSVAFTPDSKCVAYASWDVTANKVGVYVLDCQTGKVVHHFGEQDLGIGVLCVQFSPDGRVVACRWSQLPAVFLYEAETGKELHRLTWEGGQTVRSSEAATASLAFSPDSKRLASAAGDEALGLWEVASGKSIRTLPLQHGGLPAVVFSPDGLTLATGGRDKTSRNLWDHHITLWDVAAGKQIRQFPVVPHAVESLHFSGDGATLATAGGDNRVRLWETATGKERFATGGHQDEVTAVAIAPDGRFIVSGGKDATVRLWDVASAQELRRLDEHLNEVRGVAFAPDGRTVASGSYSRPISLHDVTGQTPPRRFGEAQNGVGVVRFSPDGKIVASGRTDHTIRLWDVAEARELRVLKGHQARLNAVAFAPDGRTFASASDENNLRLWEVATGREIRQFAGHEGAVHAVAFSPDGRLLASGGADKVIRLWRADTGQPLAPLRADAGIRSLAFAPDGRTLAAGSTDATISIWEMMTGTVRQRLRGHGGPVAAVAFASRGQTLVSGSSDGTLLLWDMTCPPPAKEAIAKPLPAGELAQAWTALSSDDAAAAFTAQARLAADPRRAVAYLGQRVQPAIPAHPARLQRLIADLENPEFAVREKASEELEQLGEQAEPTLRRVLDGAPALEVQQRVDRLWQRLQRWPRTDGDALRALRALEVLENVATAEARRGLEALARGAPAARLTREAKAALDRLAQTPGRP